MWAPPHPVLPSFRCAPCPHAHEVASEIQHHIHIPGRKKKRIARTQAAKRVSQNLLPETLLRTHWLGLYSTVTPSAKGTWVLVLLWEKLESYCLEKGRWILVRQLTISAMVIYIFFSFILYKEATGARMRPCNAQWCHILFIYLVPDLFSLPWKGTKCLLQGSECHYPHFIKETTAAFLQTSRTSKHSHWLLFHREDMAQRH